jgi:hypothetical protein
VYDYSFIILYKNKVYIGNKLNILHIGRYSYSRIYVTAHTVNVHKLGISPLSEGEMGRTAFQASRMTG